MESLKFSLVLKIRDMNRCRYFYRDVLGLGDPLLESRQWTEFSLGQGATICLDSSDAALPKANETDAVCWLLRTDSPAALLERLSRAGYEPLRKREIVGYRLYLFRDPEDNPFYVSSPLTH